MPVAGDYVSVLSHGLLASLSASSGSGSGVSISTQNTQQWIPWKESGTFVSVLPNSTNITTVVDEAAFYQLGNGESSPTYGVYTKYDIRVTVATDALAWTPKPRDTVAWKGDTYTMLEVDGTDWMEFYVITARNLILHADLRSTGLLERPSTAQDSAGRMSLATYSTVTSSIPCRVQQQPSPAGNPFSRRTIPKQYTAYVGVLLDARAKDRFTVSGTVYSVVAVRNPERIDQLQELDLELIS